ncbi:MAG TPA: anti-sigma factor [Streptosporangiaceae bacterium]|jgi:anti-sigma-K factor RskA
MKQELHALVGAYAVDALDDLERRRFEDHLAECESCARETRGLREAAAHLGTAVATPPPARLREKVLADVSRVRPLPPQLSNGRPLRPRGTPWLLNLAAAACLVVAVIMGAVAVFAQHRYNQAEGRNREVVQVLSAPDRQVESAPAETGGTGGTATVVASRSQNKAIVTLAKVPDAPKTRTYEVWFMGPNKPRPAGLLNGSGEIVLASDLGDATQIGVTVEPKGGSDQPTTEPFSMVALPT